MVKVWVRRPHSSPTRIQIPSVSTPNGSRAIELDISDDFLVDDLREEILNRYPQSLGKHHDSADLTIHIGERVLAPDESVVKILTEEYPDGQKSSGAWTIITSGGRDNYTKWWLQTGGINDLRGTHQAIEQQEYFPYTPHTVTPPGEPSRQHSRRPPPLREGVELESPRRISPDSTPSQRRNTPAEYRPRGFSKSQPFHMQLPPQKVPSTTPKVSSPLGGPPILPPRSPVRVPSEPPKSPNSGNRSSNTAPEIKPKETVYGAIPPINVLIVEDNMINAQILEAFFRKRKLKYATAVNGKEAVDKWRQGGWHLVLMDIQLPVMSGIEATKEIRRLERVNHIGVFSEDTPDPSPEDKLGDLLFPSPVIIVALTASSRESDRNEALAAGCNDFLTKPVGAPWLERKAIEWGCMQALIWTSFERQRRKKDGMEKPAVLREDSGESKESGST